MQLLPIEMLTYNKQAQVLAGEISEVDKVLSMDPIINKLDHFGIVGKHETRRYMFWTVQREHARHEVGDIQAWEFRPVDRFGRGIPGPKLVVFND